MKNKSFFILLSLFFVFGCEHKEKGNYLAPLKIEIPNSLKNNLSVKEFIVETNKTLNQWSVTLEDLVVTCNPYIGKQLDELSTDEKTALGKTMMEFVAQMGKFAVYSAEFQQAITTFESELNPEQLTDFIVVKEQFESRIEEILARYMDFGKEKGEE